MPNKKPIGIVTDTTCDLPEELIKKYNIGTVPVKAFWPEIENIPGNNIFQKIREIERRGDKSFGKTSQPAPGDFVKVFEKQLEYFEKLICLTITSKHSGTFNSACQAKRFMGEKGNNISVVDSLNGSGSLGLIVLRAVEMAEKNKSVEEIIKEMEEYVHVVHLYAMLEGPERLEASGRISPTIANWMKKAQRIGLRPLIGVKEGKIEPIGIKIGAKDLPTALYKELEGKANKLGKDGRKIRVAINHGDNSERALSLKKMIEDNLPNVEVVFVSLIDDVLGVILGADSLILSGEF